MEGEGSVSAHVCPTCTYMTKLARERAPDAKGAGGAHIFKGQTLENSLLSLELLLHYHLAAEVIIERSCFQVNHIP